jgi:hypothetical protein
LHIYSDYKLGAGGMPSREAFEKDSLKYSNNTLSGVKTFMKAFNPSCASA